MRRSRNIAAAVLALALALPSAALAQSAGDDQYQDPFSGQDGGGSNQQQGSGSGSQGQQQDAAPTTQGQTQDAAPTAAQAEPAQTGTLPRTGPQTPLALAYGWTLLIAGTALRRAARRTT